MPDERLCRIQPALRCEAVPGTGDLGLVLEPARRKFFELADVEGNVRNGKDAKEISPIAFEAVKRIDALFDIEREINASPPRSG